MSIAISDDHLALLETARRFTAARCTPEVARAAMQNVGDGNPMPVPFWRELADLGWLGLAVPEVDGGQGFGFAELAVVLEELGRSMAPGPALSTAWAASVASSYLTPQLAAGGLAGGVALGPGLSARRDGDDRVLVSGTTGPLLGACNVVVLPALVDGDERWAICDLTTEADIVAAEVESVDATRALARYELRDVGAALLPGLTRARVEAVGLALVAAEAAGGAAWCVDTAAAYARERRQFGRPIGQFQGVKHRCADMLVRLEQIRGVAWDAALALDTAPEEAALATAMAGATALDGFVDVAKDCIQVLGGIGFTWEHDAHLYLRRAVALRQLFGPSTTWRQATATAALAGTRRTLRIDLPPDAEPLRAEARATAERLKALPREERRPAMAEAGWIVPHWPEPWGLDATPVEQLVIDEALRGAQVRAPHLQIGAWAAPTIVAHGTLEQQERWVRPTLLGEISWCQLFSEPEAGSDLASLRTAATRTDGGWLLTGQKVWTSMAQQADWGICLARTNPTAPKHLGITYFIIDMKSPGLEIRPLREITGEAWFNEVFFDDVFVPDDCVIGEVDGGWPLARTTLANERVSMGSGSSFGGGLEALLTMVAERGAAALLDLDAHVLDEVGGLVAEGHTVAVLGLRTTLRSVMGAKPGPEASVRKLLGVEHDQRVQEVGLSLLGPDGATTVGDAASWTYGFLMNRSLTIAGGTSEIQRNVIGERLLGLPRDPEPTG